MCGRWLMVGCIGVLAVGGDLSAQSTGAAEKTAYKPPRQDETVRVFYTGTGQFEIITLDSASVRQVLTQASAVWDALEVPLGLPTDGFSSAITVRLVPESKWSGPAVFSAVTEPGGWVSVRVRWTPQIDPGILRRALVQALLLRQAVFWHGVNNRINVPLWLEQACTALSLVRTRPAMLDAMQQESTRVAPPAIEALLRWQRGTVDSRGWELASFWLLKHLLTDSGAANRRTVFFRSILGGMDPALALQGAYGTLWSDAATRELWWQVGFYHQSRAHGLPFLTQEESRAWLADRSRWLGSSQGREQVLGLQTLWAERKETWIKTELADRVRQLREVLTVIHPFYRNATISMGAMYEAALKGKEAEFNAAKAAMEHDAVDGRELEDATSAALDDMATRR